MAWDPDTMNAAMWQHLDKPGLKIADVALAAALQELVDRARQICMVAVFEKGDAGPDRYSYDCQR